ncbi:MAG: hypothetical protein EZS28_002848 [Streblomastix strix]|uniref:Uncharacterized protein n=1 Tax=Streblomastix strix TaxID=222440 RepID=A0A5J4X321_9EUKA|nr:MAG: hypothetical protein EZS28_002848 [Streblomastix strix]
MSRPGDWYCPFAFNVAQINHKEEVKETLHNLASAKEIGSAHSVGIITSLFARLVRIAQAKNINQIAQSRTQTNPTHKTNQIKIKIKVCIKMTIVNMKMKMKAGNMKWASLQETEILSGSILAAILAILTRVGCDAI